MRPTTAMPPACRKSMACGWNSRCARTPQAISTATMASETALAKPGQFAHLAGAEGEARIVGMLARIAIGQRGDAQRRGMRGHVPAIGHHGHRAVDRCRRRSRPPSSRRSAPPPSACGAHGRHGARPARSGGRQGRRRWCRIGHGLPILHPRDAAETIPSSAVTSRCSAAALMLRCMARPIAPARLHAGHRLAGPGGAHACRPSIAASGAQACCGSSASRAAWAMAFSGTR